MTARAGPRQRSIRVMLATLFLLPLVSLLALWGFAASVTLSNAIQEHNFTNEDRLYGGAAQMLGVHLAQERLQSFIWLSSGRLAPAGPMLAQRRATDAAVAAFRSGVTSNPGVILPAARPALARSLAALGRLHTIRAAVDSGRMSPLGTFQEYNAVVDAQFRLYDQLVVVNDVPLYRQSAASIEAGRALEMADREVALVSGALVAHGQMSQSERLLFAQTVANQRLLITHALTQLDPSLRSGYQHAYASSAYARFAAMENQVLGRIGSQRPIPVNPVAWQAATTSLLKDFGAAEQQNRLTLSARGTQVGNRLLLEVVLAGGAGLIAVAISIYLMVRFGRRISRELTGLQRAALDTATDRLPRVVEQLSRGEEVDVSAEATPPATGRIAEVARVAEAFSSVQRTAIEAAVGQARLRTGVSQVFRNIAWRSQSLLHRQLALLDTMERRSASPETLEELFRLDHLTTRMRRHAEGLIILSGAAPGRGWRDPVPVVDVLRGAIAEVEDYTRVSLITRTRDAVAGAAVADVIHLLAELIENAAIYSPANTEVTVKAQRVANGFVVEIEDRGLGITEDELATWNKRLARPPEFDLADSDQLGLFVVARLAARHGIKITLRPSPYGGTAAIVLLPHAIVVAGDEANAALPGQPVPTGVGRAAVAVPEAGSVVRQLSPTDVAVGRPEVPESGSLAPDVPPYGSPGPGQAPDAPAREVGTAKPVAVSAGPTSGKPGEDAADADAATAGMDLGLPRRVRQASLVPQLKDAEPSAGGGAPEQPGPPGTRAPAESGALVASLQQGWERARTEAAQPDDPWAPGGGSAPAAGPEHREGTL
jgi:signal transduction histidine kinase